MALIDREALLEVPNVRKVTEYDEGGFRMTYLAVPLDVIEDAPAVYAEPVTGEISDGYHTFNELYHHRAMLFSVIVKAFPDKAWKARKHHDGSMYDGMFIVGVDTPDGQASYHYDIDPYWDIFQCSELEYAPEWDGHTPAQAIERIGRLEPVRRGEWILRAHDKGVNYLWTVTAYCSECCDEEQEIWSGYFPGVPDFIAKETALDSAKTVKLSNYCPNCGDKTMKEGSV